MSTEPISIEIQDKIASSIRAKLEEISRYADAADMNVERLKSNLAKLGSRSSVGNNLKSSFEGNASAARNYATATEQATAAIKRRTIATAAATRQLDKWQAAERKASATASRSGSRSGGDSFSGGLPLASLTKAGAMGAAIYAATELTGEIINLTTSYQKLQNKLTPVTGSLAETGPLMRELKDVANATYTPLDATVQAYSRFARALESINHPASEAIGLTTTVNKLLRASGATAQESGAALLQLSQAFNKGKLDGDEFRTVMELMPAAADAIAKELGVTRGELLKLAPEGKITSEVMVAAFKNAEGALALLPQPIMTIDDAFVKLKTNATLFFGESETWTRMVRGMTKSVNRLAEAMDVVGPKLSYDEMSDDWQSKNADKLLAKTKAETKAIKDQAVSIEERNKAFGEFLKQQERDVELAKMSEDDRAIGQKLDAVKKKIVMTPEEEAATAGIIRANYFKTKKTSGGKGVDRAAEIGKVNEKLADEIARMHELSDARETAAKFDSIDQTLRGKKIQLNEAETESIKTAIASIQTYSRVQAASDAMLDGRMGPAREYLANLDAANENYERGTLDLTAYNEELAINERKLRMAQRAQDESVDTMFAYNKASADQRALGMLNSREFEIESKVQQVVNDQLEKGVELRDINTAAIRRNELALRDMNEARAAENEILANTIYAADTFNRSAQALQNVKGTPGMGKYDAGQTTEMMGGDTASATEPWFQKQIEDREEGYRRIDEMRRLDLINEQTASTMKMRIWQTEQNSKLDIAKSFFSNFEGMQRSNSEEMAAVGKAAAIANATITTYQAANAAYASMAGIPIVGPALGIAAAAGAIASGLANVQAIASQPTGFQAGGWTGNGGRSDVAGVVHGQEYVMDAASTSRLGRGNLDALRNGDSSGVTGGGNTSSKAANVTVNVALFSTKEDAEAWLATRDGEKRVVEIVAANRKSLSKVLTGS